MEWIKGNLDVVLSSQTVSLLLLRWFKLPSPFDQLLSLCNGVYHQIYTLVTV